MFAIVTAINKSSLLQTSCDGSGELNLPIPVEFYDLPKKELTPTFHPTASMKMKREGKEWCRHPKSAEMRPLFWGEVWCCKKM
jgi:hypothetical protein